MSKERPTDQGPGRRSLLRRIFCRGERGQSLTELALTLPLFLVLIVGVIEVSDALNSYVTIVDAARDGARLGSKGAATDDEIKNLILVETGRLRDPVQTGDITITHTTFSGASAIRVKVCTDRSLILSVPLVMPESFEMCSTTTMRVLPGGGG
jgi:Flp pilus assembly protein TadG